MGYNTPIIHKNADKRLVYSAILVPDEPDKVGDIITAEKIEKVAHNYMERYRNVDDLHDTVSGVAVPVELYIAPIDLSFEHNGQVLKLPKGTWIGVFKITDDTVWEEITTGKRKGLSVGTKVKMKETVDKELGDVINKSVDNPTLNDIDEIDELDWIVDFVSIVDNPCVPKAEFFIVKSYEETLLDKIKGLFKSDKEEIIKEVTMTPEQVTAIVMEAMKAFKDELKGMGVISEDETQEADKVFDEVVDAVEEEVEMQAETTEMTKEEVDKDTEINKSVDDVESLKAKVAELEAIVKSVSNERDEVTQKLSVINKSKGLSESEGRETFTKPDTKSVKRDVYGRPMK